MGFLLIFVTKIYAVEPLPSSLINFESSEGLAYLKENLNTNALKLLSHFTTQKTPTYCGVASIVMVLNASGKDAPIDAYHAPYHYYTQDNVFNNQIKKIITPEKIQQKGITLAKLSQIIQSYGLKTTTFYANELTLEEFRQIVKSAISNQKFIIVNFLRTKLHQIGGGHHSLLAAYDKRTDRFLLLDVARYKYPVYWVKTEDLWKAIYTKDEGRYRGFIIITP